jgi:predicted RND superfamily exporter protein
MDPITTAIVAAITTGITGGTIAVGKQAVVDAYNAVKNLVKSKFGQDNDVAKAIEAMEKNPESKGQPIVLSEHVEASKLQQDPEILKAAQYLLDLIKQQPGGEQHVMHAEGIGIAQADRGSTATVKIIRSLSDPNN